jgi:DnaJ-class molecular chaperone
MRRNIIPIKTRIRKQPSLSSETSRKLIQVRQGFNIVLNNPEKRDIYDKYGVVDDELNNFTEFEEFMGDFGFFEEFLDDFMMMDSMNDINKFFSQMGGTKGKKSKKKRGKRTKVVSGGGGPGMKKSERAMME